MGGTTYAIELEQAVAAPRPFVWRAWTEAEHLKRWYRPDDTWSTPAAEIDLRPGGSYRIALKPAVGPAFGETGVYRDVKEPELLVYTVRFEGTHLQYAGAHLNTPTGEEMEQYETLITANFDEVAPDQTLVRVVQAGYRTAEDRDRHREGWPRFLASFAQYCQVAVRV